MAFRDKVKKALFGSPQTAPSPAKEDQAPSPQKNAPAAPPKGDGTYKSVVASKGSRGWGGPLTIAPTAEKNLIYSVTGGGIHPVAQQIADMTGAVPFDGFKSSAKFDKIAVAVIDCGGTARIGVYPMKGVLTVDIHPTTPAGPLAKFINDENFVSGVGVNDITLAE